MTLMQHTTILNNNIAEIAYIQPFVEKFAKEAELDFSQISDLMLVLEEIVVNIISYAYPKGTLGIIEISAETKEDNIVFVIKDAGVAFDPTAKEEVNINLDVEERPIGGLGLHLVRCIMDQIQYERKDGQNILTLLKNKTVK